MFRNYSSASYAADETNVYLVHIQAKTRFIHIAALHSFYRSGVEDDFRLCVIHFVSSVSHIHLHSAGKAESR